MVTRTFLFALVPISTIACSTPPTGENVQRDGSSCTPDFTPYSPERGFCAASHTVCRKTLTGAEECHGGARIIACGETGERCGKTFRCECPAPAAAPSTQPSALEGNPR